MKITGTRRPVTDELTASIVAAVENQFNGTILTTTGTTAGPVTNIFPEPSASMTSLALSLPQITNDNINQEYYIKDSAGTAATKPIYITPYSGDTIEGLSLDTLDEAYEGRRYKALKLTKWIKIQ